MARVAFYQDISYPSLGVMYLAAALRSDGHSAQVFVKTGGKDVSFAAESLRIFAPDIAAFSVLTGGHRWAWRIAGLLKSMTGGRIVTVAGGPHPTFYPDLTEDGPLDAICRGEGEDALREIAASVSAGADLTRIRNLCVRSPKGIFANDVRPLGADIDELPFPDRGVYFRKYPHLLLSHRTFITGRGCPYECTYCFNRSLKELYARRGPYVRRRDPESILSEIEQSHAEFPFRTVYFQDDVFTFDAQFLSAFLPQYSARIGLPYLCLARAELLNEDTVRLLKETGCARVFWGIESGSERLRREVLGRDVDDEVIIEKAALLKKYGIRFRTYNILGIPGETMADAERTVTLNSRIGTDYPWSSLLAAYPGTAIANRFPGAGDPASADRFTATFFRPVSGRMDAHERALMNLQRLFYWAVKFPFALPFIRLLVKFPLGFLGTFLFLVSYAISASGSEMLGFRDLFRLARHNIGVLFRTDGR